MIRSARPDELPRLQDLERAAGAAFADLGMGAVADDDPLPLEVLAGYQRDGRAWVATDPVDVPVAYLLVDVIDGAAHVEQVSVHPAHAGRRLGPALLDTAAAWAARRHLRWVTLTTFTEVPWNAPYYARLGFKVLAEDELGPGLRRLREREAAHGLNRWPRVATHREVQFGNELPR